MGGRRRTFGAGALVAMVAIVGAGLRPPIQGRASPSCRPSKAGRHRVGIRVLGRHPAFLEEWTSRVARARLRTLVSRGLAKALAGARRVQ